MSDNFQVIISWLLIRIKSNFTKVLIHKHTADTNFKTFNIILFKHFRICQIIKKWVSLQILNITPPYVLDSLCFETLWCWHNGPLLIHLHSTTVAFWFWNVFTQKNQTFSNKNNVVRKRCCYSEEFIVFEQKRLYSCIFTLFFFFAVK